MITAFTLWVIAHYKMEASSGMFLLTFVIDLATLISLAVIFGGC